MRPPTDAAARRGGLLAIVVALGGALAPAAIAAAVPGFGPRVAALQDTAAAAPAAALSDTAAATALSDTTAAPASPASLVAAPAETAGFAPTASPDSAPPAAREPLPPADLPADPVAELMRLRIEELRENGRLDVRGAWMASRTVLPALYEDNGFRRLWDTERAEELMGAVREAETDGLDPRDYHAAVLEVMARAVRNGGAAPPATLLVDRDLVLTDAFVRLWSHLRFGKLDAKVDSLPPTPRWDLRRSIDGREPAPALGEMLRAALASGGGAGGGPAVAADAGTEPGAIARLLADARPQHPLYAGLRAALIQHRGVAAAGGWPAWTPGARLDPGARDRRAPLLRRRLALPEDTSLVYDEALVTAVRAFQRRHGLADDGILGPRTQAALAVPVAARVAQLRANLERARWFLRDLDSRLLLVNIPDQSAELIEDGHVVWRSLVAVGKPLRQTPSLRARMTYLVFNPTWTVPEVILEREIIPGMRADPTTLAKRNLRLIGDDGQEAPPDAVDWARAKAHRFPYLVRMDPGPENPLGRVKFMLPNDHQVYLHDTPSKGLFARSRRAASSGCIRLEDPLGLAERLLAGQAVPVVSRAGNGAVRYGSAAGSPGPWTRAAIDSVLADGETLTVPLRRTLPVVVLYLTAWQDEDGAAQFREDLYGRDGLVLEALDARFTGARE